ncbi:hypothetical protein [Mycobacterium sp. OTB74]|uniref:hypothetical protein n=1 Tax=Mycobacterium sp. OTB74 TaxID=1853452 RepID=UPI0024751A0B|nr:hypothetical protein [Mycobacterium sp. OTB74]MDH6245777.1 hypothetical protein [Mycobacterium sp. OTB74]
MKNSSGAHRPKESETANAGKTPPTEPLTARERRTVLSVIGIVGATLVVAAAVAFVVGERSPDPANAGDQCVTVGVASSMGGGVEHNCGAAARAWCSAAYQKQDVHAEAIRQACLAAGIGP